MGHFLLVYDLSPDYMTRRAALRGEHLKLAWAAPHPEHDHRFGLTETPSRRRVGRARQSKLVGCHPGKRRKRCHTAELSARHWKHDKPRVNGSTKIRSS